MNATKREKINRLSKRGNVTVKTYGYTFYRTLQTILQWDKNGVLSRINKQRGSTGKTDFKNSILNDLIHRVLNLTPIVFYIVLENGLPEVNVSDFLKSPKKYLNQGYRFCIVDGSQRIRTIVGFLTNILKVPSLISPNVSLREKTSDTEQVSNVLFSDLPADVQEEILSYKIPFVIEQGTLKDYVERFYILNSYRTPLNEMEIYHDLYGDTAMWKDTIEMLTMPKYEATQKLLGVKDNICYDMSDTSNEAYYQKNDRGALMKQLFKMMIHVNDNDAHLTQGVTASIATFLNKYSDNKKWKEFLPKFLDAMEMMCKTTSNSYTIDFKKSMNRMRSMFAAIVRVLNRNMDYEGNLDMINNLFEEIILSLPVSQQGCGQSFNINAEVDMYTSILRFILNGGCEDDAENFGNQSIESLLTFDKDGHHYELYPILQDAYYELTKMSA